VPRATAKGSIAVNVVAPYPSTSGFEKTLQEYALPSMMFITKLVTR